MNNRILSFLLVALLFSITNIFAQTSSYCETPIGHLGDPNFGAPDGRALLTVNKISANSIEVIIKKRADSPAAIDKLYVAVFGQAPVTVGTHDGEILPEYRAVITFEGTPPTEVHFLNIQWMNPGSPGTWTLNDLKVPFNATCTPLEPAPVFFLLDNFQGAVANWNSENGTEAFEIVDNPDKTGINNSTKVMKTGRPVGSPNWAAMMRRGYTLNTNEYRYLHVMMLRNVIGSVPNAKVSDTAGGDIAPMEGQTMTANVWQDVVFDLQAVNGQCEFLYFMLDRADVLSENLVCYIDEIIFSTSATPRTSLGATDIVKPVMETATLISNTATQAIVSLTATDTDDNGTAQVVKTFIVSDIANNLVATEVMVNTAGEATIKALIPSTIYNITIKAKDLLGNVSENEKMITFTTGIAPVSLPIDNFEGEIVEWNNENGNTEFEIVDNPLISTLNSTAKVMKSGRAMGSANWAAVMKRGYTNNSSDYRYLHVMMLRNTIATVPNAKVSDSSGGDIAPMAGQTMIANEWQDVVFDMSVVNGDYNFIYYMFDRGELTENLVCYLDEIEFSNNPAPRTAPSAVQNNNANGVSVKGINGRIVIANCNDAATLLDLSGRTIAHQATVEQIANLNLSRGLYIVKIGAKGYKVSL